MKLLLMSTLTKRQTIFCTVYTADILKLLSNKTFSLKDEYRDEVIEIRWKYSEVQH